MGVSWTGVSITVRRIVTLAMAAWIAYLSYPVVNNILSPSQVLFITLRTILAVYFYEKRLLKSGGLTTLLLYLTLLGSPADSPPPCLLMINRLICIFLIPHYEPAQAMNISFDPFRIVNSYGAFGSVTKVRHEVSRTIALLSVSWICALCTVSKNIPQ
jgi:hypothetical protein